MLVAPYIAKIAVQVAIPAAKFRALVLRCRVIAFPEIMTQFAAVVLLAFWVALVTASTAG